MLWIIVLLFCMQCVGSEDYFRYLWSQTGAADFPKPWYIYIKKFVLKTIHRTTGLNSVNTAIFSTCKNAKLFEWQSNKVFLFRTGNSCLISKRENVLLPINHVLFSSQMHEVCSATYHSLADFHAKHLKYIRGQGAYFDLQLIFAFSLDSQLRLNLTFHHIYIPNMLKNCFANNLQVSQDFVFCGIHDDFDLFPLSNQIKVAASLKETYPLTFNFTSCVFSAGILFNQKLQSMVNLQPKAIHNIVFAQIVISTYKITAHKFQSLKLYFTIASEVHVIIFDGPGILSNGTKVSFSNNRMSLSTYQCFVQYTELSSNLSSHKISYHGQLAVSVGYFVNLSKSIKFQYPARMCGDLHCVIYLHSTVKYSILRFEIWNVSFAGPQNRDCSFGGIAIFAKNEEVFQFCENNIHRNIVDPLWQRIVHTRFSTAYLVVVSHDEYSHLSASFSVSNVNCSLVKLRTCGEYQAKVLGPAKLQDPYFTLIRRLIPHKCMVIQISSGLHDKNFLVDLAINDMTITQGLIYPTCKPARLKLDQTEFKEIGTYFTVNSFIQKHDNKGRVTFVNFGQPSKVFKWKILHQELCPEKGATFINTTLAHSEKFYTSFSQKTQGGLCHVQSSAFYHIKTTMNVFDITFPFLTSNWVVLTVKSSKLFSNEVEWGSVYFPVMNNHNQTFLKRLSNQSFETGNLALADTNSIILHVKSKLRNNSNSVFLHFKAQASLRNIKHKKLFQRVPYTYQNIYPLEKFWKSYHFVLQNNLNEHILWALPGQVDILKIHCEQNNPPSETYHTQHNQLFFSWIEAKTRVTFKPTFSQSDFGRICFLVAKKGAFIISVPFQGTMGHSKAPISWVTAFKYCTHMNISLPKFFSRDELNNLLLLLKGSPELFTITAIFIDLRVKFSLMRQVSS